MATPLDFPSSPAIGQIYNAPNGVAYQWDGAKWVVIGGTGAGGATVVSLGPTPPNNPQVGWLWWRSDPDGNLFVWYNDGTSAQWVPAMSSVGQFTGGATSPWTDNGTALVPVKGAAYPMTVGPITMPLGADILWGPGNPQLLTDPSGNLSLVAGATTGGVTITPAPSYETVVNSLLRLFGTDQVVFDNPTANPTSGTVLGKIRFASNNRDGVVISALADATWSVSTQPSRLRITMAGVDVFDLDGTSNAYFGPSTRLRIGDFTTVPRDSLDLANGLILGVSGAITPIAGNLQYASGHLQAQTGSGPWVYVDGQHLRTVTGNTTLTVADDVVKVDASANAAMTLTLPAASSVLGKRFIFHRHDAGTVSPVIQAAGGDLLYGPFTTTAGIASYTLATLRSFILQASAAGEWTGGTLTS